MKTLLLLGGNIVLWFQIASAVLGITAVLYGCYLFNKTVKQTIGGVC